MQSTTCMGLLCHCWKQGSGNQCESGDTLTTAIAVIDCSWFLDSVGSPDLPRATVSNLEIQKNKCVSSSPSPKA